MFARDSVGLQGTHHPLYGKCPFKHINFLPSNTHTVEVMSPLCFCMLIDLACIMIQCSPSLGYLHNFPAAQLLDDERKQQDLMSAAIQVSYSSQLVGNLSVNALITPYVSNKP